MPTTYQQGQVIDHYEIKWMLGHGGMNHVYLARDVQNGQEVVLKFPNDDLLGNVAIFERYRREAEIGSRLNHPRIQQLLNPEEARCEQYLVMEYIEGQTLRTIIEEYAPKLLPQERVIMIIRQVCEALAYAHDHGIYHRDIKPENVMLLDNGEVKLIDFGVALLEGARRVTWRGLTETVGTPDYMSPEQLRGERGTAGSDIYAVGAMFYELLCGRPPFDGENVFAVLNQHINEDPPSILKFKSTLSPALATVVMRAIRRDPHKRYSTIQEMLTALNQLDKVKPVEYEPEVPKDQNLRKAILATLIVIAIFVGLIAFGILAQMAQHLAH